MTMSCPTCWIPTWTTCRLKVMKNHQPTNRLVALDDAPVVRFVNKVLLDAINSGVSDIHFEPYEKTYRIRYRSDGMLHEIASPPASMAMRLFCPPQGDVKTGYC